MKKLSLGIIAVLLTSTTFAFGGDGCPRVGECTVDAKAKSVPAKVTISHNKGASQRNFRYSFKRQIKLSRKQTREQKSQLLDKRFYRGSYHRPELEITKAPLNWLQEIQAKLKAKREQK